MSSSNSTKKQKGGKGGFKDASKSGKTKKTKSDPETDEEDTPEYRRLESMLQSREATLDSAMKFINTLKTASEPEAKALLAQLRANQESNSTTSNSRRL